MNSLACYLLLLCRVLVYSLVEIDLRTSGACRVIVPQGEDEEDGETHVTYDSGDLYNPAATFPEPRLMSKVEARHPLKPQPFVVLETPFARNFR